MASSPEYLAPSVQNTETIDIDPALTGLAHGSCSSIPPSTVSYSTPDPNVYSEVSHISPFDASPVIDERLLTPVSSAASPQLQQRSSCRQSPFEQQQYSHSGECTAQQPTPPHTATMYAYSDYPGSGSQPAASSPMSMPAVTEASQHEHLLPFLQHPSPGGQHHHDDAAAPPPPAQTHPYFGSYSVSMPQDHDPYYMPHAGDIAPMSLLRQDVHGDGSYTHRPLASFGQQQQQQQQQHPSLFSPHQHPYHHRLARLSPTQSRQYAVPRARRDRTRKASVRQGGSIHRRGSFSTPVAEGMPLQHTHIEDNGPDEEVTLDDKTPADLRRLWDIRRKWLGKKGNGMWEDIMQEYLGEEHMTENKKTQVKAKLQMKIHRMLLKHGKWPERDEAALLRAYKRWEENRYVEILRLYEEEMAGYNKAYDWKSQHIEAELVKMGLEQPERDRDSKARRRKQVAARHSARAGGAPGPPRGAPLYQRLPPGMYDTAALPKGGHPYAPYYEPQQQRAPTYNAVIAEQIGAHPPVLSDEQNERLVQEILERNPFSDNGEDDCDDVDVDIKMELSDYGSSKQQQQQHSRQRTASLVSGLDLDPSAPQQQQHSRHHSISASPDLNTQRSAAVARQACGEMLKHQQFDSGVGA